MGAADGRKQFKIELRRLELVHLLLSGLWRAMRSSRRQIGPTTATPQLVRRANFSFHRRRTSLKESMRLHRRQPLPSNPIGRITCRRCSRRLLRRRRRPPALASQVTSHSHTHTGRDRCQRAAPRACLRRPRQAQQFVNGAPPATSASVGLKWRRTSGVCGAISRQPPPFFLALERGAS